MDYKQGRRDAGTDLKSKSFALLFIFTLSSCSNVEKVQHIEVFTTKIFEQNEEGLFETTGYKKVNAITSIEQSKNHINTVIRSIEDIYDVDGNYIRTEIIHSMFNKTYIT